MKRTGRCYELAFERVVKAKTSQESGSMRLIHGVIRDTNLTRGGALICHAWVEQGGNVWEPVLDSTMPKSVFMHMFDATAIHHYSPTEAIELALSTKHSGPWHEMPDHLQRTLKPKKEAA